jgi:hypothetical protein
LCADRLICNGTEVLSPKVKQPRPEADHPPPSNAEVKNACEKSIEIIFKNSFPTAKKTKHFTITKTSSLVLFKEIIAVYSENYTNPINTPYGQSVQLLKVRRRYM